jgi:hypothetical protein
MAILHVTTKTGDGATLPFAAIDGIVVPLASDGTGQVTVTGTCGDESQHILLISFNGPVGATMGAVVNCGASTVSEIKESKITAPTDGFGGTHRRFKL